MFGYVLTNKQELKIREFEEYQSWYCGLCRTLKRRGGIFGQMALNYDMTFLILLLHGLYEPEEQRGQCRCLAHPAAKHATCRSEFTEYAADMNLLLMYYKCMDDWCDQKKLNRLVFGMLLKRKCREVKWRYPQKTESIAALLSELSRLEQERSADLDRVSGCFGRLMGQVLAVRKDIWEKDLKELGFYLGKFIYLLDAYEDLETDRVLGNYNPLLAAGEREDFEQWIFHILEMMMAECAVRFERLPILENADILRNILYSGVWCRYEIAKEKRKETEKNHGKGSL